MKIYDVNVTGKYKKSMVVLAENAEEAKEKVSMILFETDLLEFDDEDFFRGDVDISERKTTQRLDCDEENDEEDDEPCCICKCRCPVCGECLYDESDSR